MKQTTNQTKPAGTTKTDYIWDPMGMPEQPKGAKRPRMRFGGFPDRYVYWDGHIVGSIEPMEGKTWAYLPDRDACAFESFDIPQFLLEPLYGHMTQRSVKSSLRFGLRRMQRQESEVAK